MKKQYVSPLTTVRELNNKEAILAISNQVLGSSMVEDDSGTNEDGYLYNQFVREESISIWDDEW